MRAIKYGKHHEWLNSESYQPEIMRDHAKEVMGVLSDSKFCERLHIAKPTLSKIRNKKQPVSAALLLAIHDATGLSISDLRGLMGIATNIGEQDNTAWESSPAEQQLRQVDFGPE